MRPRLIMDWIGKHASKRRIAFVTAYGSVGLFALATTWGILNLIAGETATVVVLLLALAAVTASCAYLVFTFWKHVAKISPQSAAPLLYVLNIGTTLFGLAYGGAHGNFLGAFLGVVIGSVGMTCVIALVSQGLKSLHQAIDRAFPPR